MALEIAAFVRAGFMMTAVARLLPGLVRGCRRHRPSKLALETRSSLRRDFDPRTSGHSEPADHVNSTAFRD